MEGGGPVEAVRALYEASVAGEDPSVHAVGPLATAMHIEFESAREAEVAARSFVPQTLELVRDDGNEAVVTVRGDYRLAYRNEDEWKPHAQRIRGRARVRRTEQGWKVVDLPAGSISAVRTIGEVGAMERDGDLDIDVALSVLPLKDEFSIVVANRGERPLTLTTLELELPLRFDAAIGLARRPVIQPNAHKGLRFGWVQPYRFSRGRVRVTARDDAGRLHTARRAFAPPPDPPLQVQIGRLFSWPRVLELATIVFVVTGIAPWWLRGTLIPGALLLLAAVLRAPSILYLLRHGARAAGVELAATLVAAEAIAGTTLIFYEDRSWTTVIIWATFVGLLVPVARQIFARRPQE